MVLHKGEIAEMRTGEGNTFVAILPAYLNRDYGEESEGLHIVQEYVKSHLDLVMILEVMRIIAVALSPVAPGLSGRIYSPLDFSEDQFDALTWLSNYSSTKGVIYCKPHFEQLFKETVFEQLFKKNGNFSKN
ncbi:hypothetical protein Sjap_011804 [Stephania japonica]|uniref:SecA family profile domain-containing protein n=1 Tax=Stephania japonica TaxID=461633 RepID=A0AAP0P505_9MAGN